MNDRPALPGVAVCVSDARRRRIESAIDGNAVVQCFASFAALIATLDDRESVEVIIVDASDSTGVDLKTAVGAIARCAPEASIVLYASVHDIGRGAIASPHIRDLILAAQTDACFAIRQLIFNAVNRRAADRVVAALRQRLPGSLADFTERAVRFPSLSSVEKVADHMGIHRQTAAVWSRKAGCCRPEELMIWSRLLLLSVLLEKTSRSVGSLATDLEFSSVIAMRNSLKRYTGMTALEVRRAGFHAVLERFDSTFATARSVPEPSRERAAAR